MSVAIETVVYCDGCGENCCGDDRNYTAKEIRKSRKIDGWKQVGSKDYCPECYKKLKESDK